MGDEVVGIVSWGTYFPQQYLSKGDLSRFTGIDEEIFSEKFGLQGKYRAAAEEHVSDMAVAACRDAMGDVIDPAEIDIVIYFGSEYKDYHVWSVAADIQHRLGISDGYALELMSLCATGVLAFNTARALLLADDELETALVVAATKEENLIDYSDMSTRFMFNFGDGAAAAVLRKGHNHNVILGSAAITDGQFSRDVLVPAGGSVLRPRPGLEVPPSDFMLRVPDIESMKDRLTPVTLNNFAKVIKRALTRSGLTVADIDFFGATHMKRSFYQEILQAINLDWDQTYYLERYGHVQAADQIIILSEASRTGLLKDGDIVVLAGAGTGYTWSAGVLHWGLYPGAAATGEGDDR